MNARPIFITAVLGATLLAGCDQGAEKSGTAPITPPPPALAQNSERPQTTPPAVQGSQTPTTAAERTDSGAGTSKQESTVEYFDDTWITTKVKAALLDDPLVKSAEVNVETSKGTVQLSGFVSTSAQMEKAVEIARGIQGVTSVENDMQIK